MAEKNSRRNETTDALFDAILSLESREECYAFFEDLCTIKEISDMAQRLQAAKLLLAFDMLVGRLEIFPMLLLFAPSIWKRRIITRKPTL